MAALCTTAKHLEHTSPRRMRVFACVAHRGDAGFLRPLYDNTQKYLHPVHTCVFTHVRFNRSKSSTFLEAPGTSRHGDVSVLSRYVRCFQYLTSTRVSNDALDVLVGVASNQVFFKHCHVMTNTFSFTPKTVTLYNNVMNPFGRPVGYPSREWDLVAQAFARRAITNNSTWRDAFGVHNMPLRYASVLNLKRKYVTHFEVRGAVGAYVPRSLTPLCTTQGSFYTMAQLQNAYDTYLRAVALAKVDAQFAASFLEEWLLASHVAADEDSRSTSQLARPNLCARVYTSIRITEFEQLKKHLDVLHPWYCCVKLPGAEHVQLQPRAAK